MTTSESLRDLFFDALRDCYDSKRQFRKALRRMAGAAQHPAVEATLSAQIVQTHSQLALLKAVFVLVQRKVKPTHCAGMAGILEEGDVAMKWVKRSALRDAVVLGTMKRAVHYDIASASILLAMAVALEVRGVSDQLNTMSAQELVLDTAIDALTAIVLAEAAAAEIFT